MQLVPHTAQLAFYQWTDVHLDLDRGQTTHKNIPHCKGQGSNDMYLLFFAASLASEQSRL